MNLNAKNLKDCLKECISEIVARHNDYSLVSGAFSRTRKWPLDKLIPFILSFGSQSLGTEILEYFQFQNGSPSVSSFVQQRKNCLFVLWKIFLSCFIIAQHLHRSYLKDIGSLR